MLFMVKLKFFNLALQEYIGDSETGYLQEFESVF